MCHVCRAKIRERAIAKQMEMESIPVEMRAVFERGAKFGELQAGLFAQAEYIRTVGPVTELINLLKKFGDTELEESSNQALDLQRALAVHQMSEGCAITYGKQNAGSIARLNVLEGIHGLELTVDPGPKEKAQGQAKQTLDDLLTSILAQVAK